MADIPPNDFPLIDAHTHVFHDRPYLANLLDEWQMRVVVINITGKGFFARDMDTRWREMRVLEEQYPDRVFLCTSFDPAPIAEPGFADDVVATLREHVTQGASMVKVWKDIGLVVRDADGSYVQIDNERLQPIWDFLAERRVPVLAHIGEPRAAWLPLDTSSPHYRFYSDNPQQHLYRRDDVPAWEDIMAARDRWVERNPELTIIGAHLGSMAYDVDEVAACLDRYPNFYVDTAERFGDLVTQPSEQVRDFFVRYSDRILYGTDVILEHPASDMSEDEQWSERTNYEELLQSHWRYLAGAETIEIADKLLEPVHVPGLHLPRPVLEAVYASNAERLLNL